MILKILQFFQPYYKYANEILFICLFVSVITVNKYVLSELRFTVPTVFQGWQTLSCVILLTALIKFNKITDDLQVLDAKALSLFFPALICFAFGIVAGSKALADLPVPVFLAITNLYSAIIVLLEKKKDKTAISLKVCGSTGILGTVIIIIIYNSDSSNSSSYVWLFGHIILTLFYYLYLRKLNLDLTNTTQIYYRNIFSVILLFPISIYLDVLHLPRTRTWEFYMGCFLSGVLGTFLQIWTFKIVDKSSFLQIEGFAKVISCIIAHNLLFVNIEPFTWFLIIINILICGVFLKAEEKDTEERNTAKPEILLAIPPEYLKSLGCDGVLLV